MPKSEKRFLVGNKQPQGAAHPLGQPGNVRDFLNAIDHCADRVAERILALQITKLIGERQIMRGGAEQGMTFRLPCNNHKAGREWISLLSLWST